MIQKLGFLTLAVSFAIPLSGLRAQVYTGITDAMPIAINLEGNTKYDGWYNLSTKTKTDRVIHGTPYPTMAGLSGYPDPTASGPKWAAPIASQLQSDATHRAQINKITNSNGTGFSNGLNAFEADGSIKAGQTWSGTGLGPTPASDGLYALSFSNVPNTRGGTLGVFEAAPVANLKNVFFQLELNSANGYDLVNNEVNGLTPGLLDSFSGKISLTLTFGNGTTEKLDATYAMVLKQGLTDYMDLPIGPDGEDVATPIYANLYGFQWDLSRFTDIASFYINFEVVQHTSIYAMQLDQSDYFNAIPEPSTWAMAATGLLTVTALRLRRRRNA